MNDNGSQNQWWRYEDPIYGSVDLRRLLIAAVVLTLFTFAYVVFRQG